MNCPICQKAGLADDANHCPQCNSDLSGLHRLRNISVASAPEMQANSSDAAPAQSNKIAPILLATAALLFASVAILFWRKPNETNVYSMKNTAKIEAINMEKDSLNAVIAAMQEGNDTEKHTENTTENTSKNATTTPYIYVAQKGDNLARIAHFFYGNAHAYPQILKDNNLPDNYLLLVGDSLTLNLHR